MIQSATLQTVVAPSNHAYSNNHGLTTVAGLVVGVDSRHDIAEEGFNSFKFSQDENAKNSGILDRVLRHAVFGILWLQAKNV